jgi:UPF0271 protein
MKREEMANCLIHQIGALKGFLDAEGMILSHIKPHGSLYGMAARMEHIAHAVCDATEAAARRVRAIHEGLTRSKGGIDVPTGAESICVHSDTPNAVEIAQAVRAAILPLAA